MSTPMFQEALIEAKKLRDVAATEAKNAVLEAVSPLIKQMIDQEISGIIVEQDEMAPAADAMPPTPPTPSPDAGSTGPVDAAPPAGAAPSETTMPTMKPAVAAAAPPIVAPGTPVAGKIDISPTGQQQIVIPVDALFQKETSPAATGTIEPEPPPAGPETVAGAPPAPPAQLETPPPPPEAQAQLAEIYRAVQKLLREQSATIREDAAPTPAPPAAPTDAMPPAPPAPPAAPGGPPAAGAPLAVPPAAPAATTSGAPPPVTPTPDAAAAVPPAAPAAPPAAPTAGGPPTPAADPNALNTIAGAPTPPAAPPAGAAPAPAPPTQPVVEYKLFKEKLGLVENNIQSFRKGNMNGFLKEAHEKQLFGLYQSLINLKNKNAISSRLFSFNEDRLGLLYENLNVITSYKRNPLEKGKNMAKDSSLKDLVRALFEGAEGFEEEVGKVDPAGDSEGGDSDHAHRVSGNPKGVKAEAEDAPFRTRERNAWPGGPSKDSSLLEQLEEEISEMLGEVGEDEGGHSGHDMEEEIGEEAVLELDNNEVVAEARKAKARLKALREQAEDKLSLTIDLDGVSGADVENVNISLDGEDLEVDMEDEEGMEDEEDMSMSDEEHSEEGMEEEESDMEEESLHEARKLVRKVARSVNENKVLRGQLAETQLLTARSLYVNKLFVRDDLSGAQKRKIVEYLDSARTLAEAKEIYNRVVRVLNTAKKNGMMNESVTSGRNLLSESAGYVEPSFDTSRWQVLAGVKRSAK